MSIISTRRKDDDKQLTNKEQFCDDSSKKEDFSQGDNLRDSVTTASKIETEQFGGMVKSFSSSWLSNSEIINKNINEMKSKHNQCQLEFQQQTLSSLAAGAAESATRIERTT
jgi:hypothetical protein